MKFHMKILTLNLLKEVDKELTLKLRLIANKNNNF